jgi:glycosyltransferase involved in cell wall biosynthesis
MLIHGAVDNDLYPPRLGSAQRNFGLYRGLARRHQVQVLCVVPNRSRAEHEQRIDGVTLIRRRAWYTSLAWRLERMRIAPMMTASYGHALSAGGLRRALPGAPDVFAADFNLTPLLSGSRAPLKAYVSQNVELDYFETAGEKVWLSRAWAAGVRAREARALDHADAVVAVGPEDAGRLIALYGVERERIDVIPNGWDDLAIRQATPVARASARTLLGLGGNAYVALFVGSDVPHNRAALEWILRELLPLAEHLGIVLLIAGRVGRIARGRVSTALRNLGEVDDVTPLLHAADVGLNPVLAGGGSNVKLPAYLAAGLAVLSTPFGVRGYESLAPLAIVTPPEQFAEALTERPRGWAARGEAMPEAVAEHAWSRLGERLGARWSERLSEGAARKESA